MRLDAVRRDLRTEIEACWAISRIWSKMPVMIAVADEELLDFVITMSPPSTGTRSTNT